MTRKWLRPGDTFEQERIDDSVVERDACWVDFAESSSYPRQKKHFLQRFRRSRIYRLRNDEVFKQTNSLGRILAHDIENL